MMYSYLQGNGMGAGFGVFAIFWILWVLVWTFNSVMVGAVLVALYKYLQSKTK